MIIKNGTIVDPSQSIDTTGDLLIREGKIAEVGVIKTSVKGEAINATGMMVVPGLVDMHTHLREPGQEYKEDIASGSAAACAGGFTSITAMPNTDPVNDTAAVTKYILEQARRCGLVNVFPIGAATKGQKGRELSEIAELSQAGVVALSDDGKPVADAGMMRMVMEYAGMFNLPVISHCEDSSLAGNGVMNEGAVSTRLGLEGIPGAAEEVMVARDIALSRLTKRNLHIAHISTAESVELVRRAKKEGLSVTCEVTPHHFILTDEAILEFDTNTKVNPPLRRKKDIEAIKKGLQDGTIDAIATDHAPHDKTEKFVEYQSAPFGISGLETALSLSLTLYHEKVLSFEELVAKLTKNPATILRIRKGSLVVGADADIALINLNKEIVIDSSLFKSKGKNSPFDGYRLKGTVEMTICNGKVVFDGRK